MNAAILWFTGLSGSGKTTIAKEVRVRLVARGKKVLILDGDVVRGTVHKNLRFTPADIRENNRRIAAMCQESLGLYDYILVPVISPFRESREQARRLLSPAFIEIYVKTDLNECIRRDVKGLYKKALEGMIDNFIGISRETPYEAPERPEIVLDTQKDSVSTCVESVLGYIERLDGA